MNKQEVIEKLIEHGAWCTECHDINGKKDRYVKSAKVRELLDRLDEPQVTNEQAWNKIAESYPETAQNLRITLDHAVYGHETEPQKVIAHLAEKWHEDIGPVLWWNFPVEEPPYCGTPLDEHFPSYKTHFTQITMPDEVEEEPRWVVKKREDSYFKSFTGIDFRSSSVAYEDYACLFADRAKAEAVAMLIDGIVEKV